MTLNIEHIVIAVGFLSQIGVLVWKIASIKAAIEETIVRHRTQIDERQHAFEIFVRDNFARRDSMKEALAHIDKSMADFRSDVTTRLNRLNDKVDRRTEAEGE